MYWNWVASTLMFTVSKLPLLLVGMSGRKNTSYCTPPTLPEKPKVKNGTTSAASPTPPPQLVKAAAAIKAAQALATRGRRLSLRCVCMVDPPLAENAQELRDRAFQSGQLRFKRLHLFAHHGRGALGLEDLARVHVDAPEVQVHRPQAVAQRAPCGRDVVVPMAAQRAVVLVARVAVAFDGGVVLRDGLLERPARDHALLQQTVHIAQLEQVLVQHLGQVLLGRLGVGRRHVARIDQAPARTAMLAHPLLDALDA